MDPKRLRALSEYIPKGGAPKMRSFGLFGSALAVLAAPMGLLVYNSLYNGMLHSAIDNRIISDCVAVIPPIWPTFLVPVQQ